VVVLLYDNKVLSEDFVRRVVNGKEPFEDDVLGLQDNVNSA